MITAHAPSGYVLSRLREPAPWLVPASILGAVFPDFDLIWFYLIDDRAFHHHQYWVHIPAFWCMVAVVGLPFVKLIERNLLPAAIGFLLAIILHICLDTIAGGVMWHWPFDDRFTHLVSVPAQYENWILNFVLHPVFVLELLIWVAAGVLWWRRPR